ncbi:MAG: BMP family ABC transporter substrate-binding protein [Clostridia bacterium]|nr:BMP family ABC transporter substrate-binding protein [Clostridia bacterium]
MKKFLTMLLTVVLAVSSLGLFTGCGDDGEFKVGLICLHGESSTYDKNFIDAFNAACAAKGVESIIKVDIAESTACYDAAADLVDQGCDLIFADSFGHEDHMIKAANEFRGVQFFHATGTKAHTETLTNYHNAFASIYEGRYLAGIAGGMKLKELLDAGSLKAENFDANGNVKVGYVGAWTYAEVISGFTSWFLGVRSVVPNVVMDVQFTGSWYDEAAEKTAAELLISKGCALISQHADSMGAPTACETAGIPNVSYNGSTATQCPNTFIVSSRINWQPYYELIIDSVKNNKIVPLDWSQSLGSEWGNGSVALTSLGNAAAEGTEEAINEAIAKLKDGSLKVFDLSKFTVNGNALADDHKADVDTDAAFTPDTVVIKTTESGIKYFAESEFRSAPYFDLCIDGITYLNTKY